MGTKVEGALDRSVEPDAVRDAAVARVVDRPIEIASWVDGESGGFGDARVLDGEGDCVLGSGDRWHDRKEHDGQQQQPEASPPRISAIVLDPFSKSLRTGRARPAFTVASSRRQPGPRIRISRAEYAGDDEPTYPWVHGPRIGPTRPVLAKFRVCCPLDYGGSHG